MPSSNGNQSWVPFRVFLDFALSRGFELMRSWGNYRVFWHSAQSRTFMVEVLNKMVRRDDLDDFDFFSHRGN